MLNFVSTCKKLPALLLLAAMLILPLDVSAQGFTLVGTQDSCVCQSLLPDAPAGESNESPEQHQRAGAEDCCDSEERSSDAAEIHLSTHTLSIAANLFFHPNPDSYLPKVYLSIFVPPEI